MAAPVLDEQRRVVARLGEGGMGEVYLVENLRLERREAVKVLLPTLAAQPQLVQRFRREARATLRLQHPHIVGGYDFGRLPDGRLYLAMEYVEGETLDRLLAREGPLPMPRALPLLAQLALAVAHAHECGVVHRDLKPSNLMLSERVSGDYLKVLDFGIAKIVAPDYRESRALSVDGEVFGTVLYMAPEQVTGQKVDPRCDLYAIGCIAFEMLTGTPPFVGRRMEILDAQLRRTPEPPSRRRPEARIPPELDAVVLRCLEKDPARRFQNGRELRNTLERVPGFAARARRPPSLHSLVTQPMVLLEQLDDLGRTLFEQRPGSEPTEALPPAGRVLANALIVRLGEALVDRGHTDVQLVVGIARLSELEGELARLCAEEDVLEARGAQLEAAAREREAALHGSIGELRFEREEGGDRGEIDRSIAELEIGLLKIVRQLEQDRQAIADRAIELVARKATIEDKLRELSVRLEQLVVEKLPLLAGTEELDPIVERFRKLPRGLR